MPSYQQRVLIVDDEPRNQRIASETLEGVAAMEVAATGEAALARMATFRPDLVLLDIMMPGIDGYEVCRRLKADPAHARTKVILISGKAMIDERLKGYAAGADDYMTKPFVPEELLAKCRVFLRLTAAEREVRESHRQLLEAQARLVNTAKMAALGEMAGGIAHEINTPLGTIGMVAEQIQELLGDEALDRETIQEMAAVVRRTVGRIGSIVSGLRTFSRDGSHDRMLSAPLTQIVDDTLILCRERLKHSNIRVEVSPAIRDLSVECRPVQITQVLLNLISNACDAIHGLPDKWISLGFERRDASVFVSVTDSGGGIPASVRERLFQPFFTTKEIGQGTGLGLSVSKGIMDAHLGSLQIDEDCPNTRFVVRIPAPAPGSGEVHP